MVNAAKILKPSVNGNRITPAEVAGLLIKPLSYSRVSLVIKGISPLLCHKWSDKARKSIRDKQAGKKTKDRAARDPEAEANEATYFTASGTPGVPAMAIKSSIISAAHKDLGIEKTLVRKAIFIDSDDPQVILPLTYDKWDKCDEQFVRVGMGSSDIRYRPCFYGWRVALSFIVETNMVQVSDLITLIDRAGQSIGICEWRPENGGEYGRFVVCEDSPIHEDKMKSFGSR